MITKPDPRDPQTPMAQIGGECKETAREGSVEANPASSVPIPSQVDYGKLLAHHEPIGSAASDLYPHSW